MAGVAEKFVYQNLIDNRQGLRQMREWENKVKLSQDNIAKYEAKAEQRKRSEVAKTTKAKMSAQQKEQAAKLKAQAKEQARIQRFEQWKTAQFRSATFEKLSLEQQMQIKRVLSAKKSEDEIRDEYKATTALIRRENKRRAAYERKASKLSNGGGTSVVAGGAGGAMALMANPYVLGGAALIAGGGAAIASGSEQFNDTKQGANLVGMDFNEFNQLASGLMAVTEMNDVGTVADKIKDIQDRQGEVLQETTFDTKTGQFKGGEGSILANQLLKTGQIDGSKESLDKFMNQSPEQFIQSVAKATEGMNVKEQAFVLEAFGSDLQNIVRGVQANPDMFNAGKANAVGFDADQLKAATDFNLSIQGMVNAISNADMGIFQSFTEHLSPQTLEMFGRVGKAIGNIAEFVGTVLAGALNLLSPAVNLVLDVFNELMDVINPLTSALSDLLTEFTDIMHWITGFISNAFSSMMNDIKNALPSWAQSLLGIESTPSETTTPTTPPPTSTVKPSNYLTGNLPSGNKPSYSYGTQQPVQQSIRVEVPVHLDSEKVGQAVMDSEAGREGINRQMASAMY